jgi:hypothetical protein
MPYGSHPSSQKERLLGCDNDERIFKRARRASRGHGRCHWKSTAKRKLKPFSLASMLRIMDISIHRYLGSCQLLSMRALSCDLLAVFISSSRFLLMCNFVRRSRHNSCHHSQWRGLTLACAPCLRCKFEQLASQRQVAINGSQDWHMQHIGKADSELKAVSLVTSC